MPEDNQLTSARKCVNFIYGEAGKGKPIGTGFFFGISAGDPDNSTIMFMVTAKHVLFPDGRNHLKTINLRLRRRDGSEPIYEPVKLGSPHNPVFTHDDANVDIAMFQCQIYPDEYDFRFIPVFNIPTEAIMAEMHIAEGTPIFIAGLFSPYSGEQSDQPLIRFGRISLIPEGKIPVQPEGQVRIMINAYLCESLAFRGNSGSPVFFAFERVDDLGRVRYDQPDVFLAGVVKGHYPDLREQAFEKRQDGILYQINAGISVITPSFELLEILKTKAMEKFLEECRARIEALPKDDGSTPQK